MQARHALTPRAVLRKTIITIPDIENEDAGVRFCPPHCIKQELQTS